MQPCECYFFTLGRLTGAEVLLLEGCQVSEDKNPACITVPSTLYHAVEVLHFSTKHCQPVLTIQSPLGLIVSTIAVISCARLQMRPLWTCFICRYYMIGSHRDIASQSPEWQSGPWHGG